MLKVEKKYKLNGKERWMDFSISTDGY